MSRLLVALQFGLMALVAVRIESGGIGIAYVVLLVSGTAVGAWALAANRPGNFHIRPDPRPGGRLVERGPYRWIRHPMYTAVIACGIACAIVIGTTWGWLGVAALVLVLAVKAAVEERWMLVAHPGYQAYRARTKRFVPGVI